MDHIRIQGRLEKIKANLMAFKDEVNTAIKLLEVLSQHSEAAVEKLEKIVSSHDYLKEWSKVNSNITKYTSLVEKITCDIESLEFENDSDLQFFPDTCKNCHFSNKTDDKKYELSVPKEGGKIKSKKTCAKNSKTKPLVDPLLCSAAESEKWKIKELETAMRCLFSTVDPAQPCPPCSNVPSNIPTFPLQHSSIPVNPLTNATPLMNIPSLMSIPVKPPDLTSPQLNVLPASPFNFVVQTNTQNYKSWPDLGTQNYDLRPPEVQNTIVKETQVQLPDVTIDPQLKTDMELSKDNKASCANDERPTTNRRFYNPCAKAIKDVTLAEDTKSVEISLLQVSREPGTKYTGVVEHVISPGEFYVHLLVEQTELFPKFIAEAKIHQAKSHAQVLPYQRDGLNSIERKVSASKVLGDCALWYSVSEDIWCRARIVNWLFNGGNDNVHVFLFDYGDSRQVPVYDLFPLVDKLKRYPVFAQKCHLAGVYPLESKSGCAIKPWSDDAKELFQVLLGSGDRGSADQCSIEVAANCGCYDEDSLPVRLRGSDEKTINELMVELEYSVSLPIPPAPPLKLRVSSGFAPQKETVPEKKAVTPEKQGTALGTVKEEVFESEFDPMRDDYLSYRNNIELDTSDPAAAIYGYVGKDYERVCPQYAKEGKCFKGDGCRKEHFRLDPRGYTTDKEEIYKSSLSSRPALSRGDLLSVEVSIIFNVNHFCCQRVQEQNPEGETLETLVRYMNKRENVLQLQKLAIPPSLGQIVVGKFSDDGDWYRAKVMETYPEKDQYKLLFVDYGNSEVVPLYKIRKIEPRYLHLSFQALRCHLHNIDISPNVTVKEAVKYFYEEVMEGEMTIKVISSTPGDNPDLTVALYNKDGKDIGDIMVSKKVAIYKDRLIPNEKNSWIPG